MEYLPFNANELSRDQVQQDMLDQLFKLFCDHHDDLEDIANWAAAHKKFSDWLALYASNTKEFGNNVWNSTEITEVFQDAMKDWPSLYDKWEAGEYQFPGGFQEKIFQAYRHADGDNKKILENAYPKWFS